MTVAPDDGLGDFNAAMQANRPRLRVVKGGGGGDSGGARPTQPKGEDFGPVVPLGVTTRRDATAYVFLDAAGLRSVLSAQNLYQPACVASLFGGQDGAMFLASRWPIFRVARDEKGKVIREDGQALLEEGDGFNCQKAGDALMAACQKAGHADQAVIRKDGVWPHSSGGLVVHVGNAVVHGQEEHRPGWRDGDAVYVFAPKRERPAAEAATVKDVEQLAKDLALWSYASAKAGPLLLLGLIGCGILGKPLPWRPHVFIRGPQGVGKSTINRLIAAACGAGEPSTDITAAGLRRMFDARSGLIPLDEREANAKAVQSVIEIMRGSSDGEGAVTVQADMEGSGVRAFVVAGCFLFTAITTPRLTAADQSRITLLRLVAGDKDQRAEVEAATARAAALHPRLLRRMLDGWDRWRANWTVARNAALAQDAASRSADQIGALLAGWATLVSDNVMPADVAARKVALLAEYMTTRAEAEEIGTPQLVLQHLLPSRVPVSERGSDQMTVQGAIAAALSKALAAQDANARLPGDPTTKTLDGDADRWRRRLGALGIRIELGARGDRSWPGRGEPGIGVFLRNGAPALEAAFAGTDWAGGAWQGPLRDLPGAQESTTSIKFPTGGQGRAVFVPLAQLGIDDADLREAPA